MANTKYKAAIYVRLSKEDGDVTGSSKKQSNSISNQKILVREYLKTMNDIEVVREYVDDGYSGSSFERPAFQMMLEDIKHGTINCVVTKDLSRFGREYIESGMYIERVFPTLGVRFIAVNDHYDSLKNNEKSDNIIIPFKNLINDAYCRDISIKIRSHLEIKRKQGQYIGNWVAYGYKKSEKDKHKIVIDPNAAEVVKEIFRMKIRGMSDNKIADTLNDSGTLCPSDYKTSMGFNFKTSFKGHEKSEWYGRTVRRILVNEIYIGTLIQGKQTTPNHKVKKMYLKEESEWVRIPNNHEAIISERDYEIVQRILTLDSRTSPDKDEVFPLSGLIVCGDCGAPMIRKNNVVAGKTYSYYLCSGHRNNKNCSPHRISVQVLDDTVLTLLQQHIQNILNLSETIKYIGEIPFQQLDMKRLEARREKLQQEVDRCTDLRSMLYADMKEGIISKDDYKELHFAYEQKRKKAEIALGKLDQEEEEILSRSKAGYKWLDYFVEQQNIDQLTRGVAISLIRQIRVMDKKSIEITFDFDDLYQDCLRQLQMIKKMEGKEAL